MLASFTRTARGQLLRPVTTRSSLAFVKRPLLVQNAAFARYLSSNRPRLNYVNPGEESDVALAAKRAKSQRKRGSRVRFLASMAVGLGIGIFWGLLDHRMIHLEDENTIQPPAKCEPFPRKMNIEGVPFQCIGVGVRVVSFLRMPVYALGIFVAQDDVVTAKRIMSQYTDAREILTDNDRSAEIVDALIRGGVRFLVRVTPVRNTDFGHLRDGFVRSILKNPAAKQLMGDPNSTFGDGLGQIKQAYGRKRRALKGDSLLMVSQANGDMKVFFSEASKLDNLEHLGDVTAPDTGRVFVLQYLTGRDPNSPTARESAIQGLLALL